MRNSVYVIANNKGAVPHPRSLISTFVVRCQDSIISLVSISEISSLYHASIAAQAGLSLTWSKTPKTGFLVSWLNWMFILLFLLVLKEVFDLWTWHSLEILSLLMSLLMFFPAMLLWQAVRRVDIIWSKSRWIPLLRSQNSSYISPTLW